MSGEPIIKTEPRSVRWYEISIPVRGTRISLSDIKGVYRELSEINMNWGEKLTAKLKADPKMSAEDWEEYKSELQKNTFCLTTTIDGFEDQQLYGETVEIFDDENLPNPIKSIYFTNATSFSRNADGIDPENKLDLFLDFSKPAVFDPRPLVSEATPNESKVRIKAVDISFYNAVRKTVESKLTKSKTWYATLHRNFIYDAGILFLLLPVALYFSAHHMNNLIPSGSNFELYRWPLFIFFLYVFTITYRVFIAYVKWALPVNVLVENKDTAWKHRFVLAGAISWLGYQVIGTVWSIIVG